MTMVMSPATWPSSILFPKIWTIRIGVNGSSLVELGLDAMKYQESIISVSAYLMIFGSLRNSHKTLSRLLYSKI